jgi:hypothetical protein
MNAHSDRHILIFNLIFFILATFFSFAHFVFRSTNIVYIIFSALLFCAAGFLLYQILANRINVSSNGFNMPALIFFARFMFLFGAVSSLVLIFYVFNHGSISWTYYPLILLLLSLSIGNLFFVFKNITAK